MSGYTTIHEPKVHFFLRDSTFRERLTWRASPVGPSRLRSSSGTRAVIVFAAWLRPGCWNPLSYSKPSEQHTPRPAWKPCSQAAGLNELSGCVCEKPTVQLFGASVPPRLM